MTSWTQPLLQNHNLFLSKYLNMYIKIYWPNLIQFCWDNLIWSFSNFWYKISLLRKNIYGPYLQMKTKKNGLFSTHYFTNFSSNWSPAAPILLQKSNLIMTQRCLHHIYCLKVIFCTIVTKKILENFGNAYLLGIDMIIFK